MGGWTMIKKFAAWVGSIVCISVLVLSLAIVDVAWAQSGGNFIVATKQSCMWAVNKSTRKLMFLKYQDDNNVWKSDPITVPSNIDLNESVLIVTGRENTQTFLYDLSSGFVVFYEVLKDRSIKKYHSVDLASDLK